MDKETRNRIQKATQAARALLEQEFAEQLEGVFDIRLDGTIAAEAGSHLDSAQRIVRKKLLAAIEHLRAGSHDTVGEAVAAYLREAAFTTLNRFVALKMLEARGLVQECISRGEQSSGFKEFGGLAAGLVHLPDHGYRLYIESSFDEIGREVRVLFDRRDPASLMWPGRAALFGSQQQRGLLEILNDPELDSVWDQDETIGWVYQFFNGDEERKQMRAESQAPRDSRELAVRNQFFTPSYVVKFLTDNTLGRIWYEMRQGETRLRELNYLVRRPTEIFLAEGETPPPEADGGDESLNQEELLKQPVHIPFRPKQDPRDLRILDPACGSGHFLLYAFDLLLLIYEEAWGDPDSPASEVTGRILREDYPDLYALRPALPGLILRHNLYGIDIDTRAAQIAAMALWMRAQRAFKDFDIPRADRPGIQKTNIVVAEPMPGEPELRREFLATLDPDLAGLLERVFKRMELAGEAGSLMKIEADIRDAVREIYGHHGALFRAEDEERWRRAEEKVLTSLREYSEKAADGSSYQRRLFAGDATRGFAFLDLCRQTYTVCLANPPFGEATLQAKKYVVQRFVATKHDLACAFAERCTELVAPGGHVGHLTNRTWLFSKKLTKWRQQLLAETRIVTLGDLGYGVLDAVVETAALVWEKSESRRPGRFVSALQVDPKEEALQKADNAIWMSSSIFIELQNSVFAYWIPEPLLRRYLALPKVDNNWVKKGLSTADNFRFFRLAWETPLEQKKHCRKSLSGWIPIAKGGEYRLYFDDIHLEVKWHDDARELKAFIVAQYPYLKGDWGWVIVNSEYYFKPALTWSYRTTSAFCLKVLPSGCAFSDGGWALCVDDPAIRLGLLALFNCTLGRYFLEIPLGQGDTSKSGTAARNYSLEPVASVPLVLLTSQSSQERVLRLVEKQQSLDQLVETSSYYRSPVRKLESGSLLSVARGEFASHLSEVLEILEQTFALLSEIRITSRFTEEDFKVIEAQEGEHPCQFPRFSPDGRLARDLYCLSEGELVQKALNSLGGKRFATKKAYYADRKIELICHLLKVHPSNLVEQLLSDIKFVPADFLRRIAEAVLSHTFGIAIGRWMPGNWEIARNMEPSVEDCFAALPYIPPALDKDSSFRVLVDDNGHSADLVKALIELPQRSGAPNLLELVEASADHCSGSAKSDAVRLFFRSKFFGLHVSSYSKSRRKAPVYWQLATPSANYSVWVYYHHLTGDSLYKVLNEFLKPKVQHEARKLTELAHDARGNPTPSQRQAIAEQEIFVDELRTFREEVARVAPLWNPDLNDGVIINFALLWRLVPQHRTWQKECKACWDKLCKGDYDWTHLAMHLWPERVVAKCAEDRSLAIAHGVDRVFWEEDDDGKWQPRKVPQIEIDQFIAKRTSAAVKDALKSLLEAPPTATGRAGGRRSSGRAPARRKTAVTTSRSTLASTPSDAGILESIKQAIGAANDDASKADVLAATGLADAQWNTAIKALLGDGSVTKSGAGRGTRYHIGTGG